jgi:hypothetical protein
MPLKAARKCQNYAGDIKSHIIKAYCCGNLRRKIIWAKLSVNCLENAGACRGKTKKPPKVRPIIMMD